MNLLSRRGEFFVQIHSPVVQLAEHLAVNEKVLGSSPSGGAKKDRSRSFRIPFTSSCSRSVNAVHSDKSSFRSSRSRLFPEPAIPICCKLFSFTIAPKKRKLQNV